MDKSPKYLKMCEEAFKDIGILDNWLFNIKIPNLWACPYYGKEKYCKLILEIKPKGSPKWFQVYRQDQLQKIHFDSLDKSALSEEEAKAAFILASISELKLLALTWNRIYDPFQSYEELWLSLVMMSMFNKRWSDSKGKWVKHQNDWWEISKEFLKEVEEKIDNMEVKNK